MALVLRQAAAAEEEVLQDPARLPPKAATPTRDVKGPDPPLAGQHPNSSRLDVGSDRAEGVLEVDGVIDEREEPARREAGHAFGVAVVHECTSAVDGSATS
jgi:hypothetical protein